MINSNFRWISSLTSSIVFCAMQIGDLPGGSIEIPSSIQKSSKKRQDEFVAGRLCAQTLCYPSVVHQDLKARPIWPSGIIGSITHTDEIAIAAVSKSDQIQGLGIDSEKVKDNKEIIGAIQHLVLVDGEESLIEQLEDYFLIFSLKESLYKCLNPLLDLSFDFKDVRITTIDRKSHLAYLNFCSLEYLGFYAFDPMQQHVHTCVYTPSSNLAKKSLLRKINQ